MNSGKRYSGLFAHRKSAIQHKSEEGHADDLPDITPEKCRQLAELWEMGVSRDIVPIKVLLNAVRKHLDAINPYIETKQDTEALWAENWKILYRIVQNIDSIAKHVSDAKNYSVPLDLNRLEAQAYRNLDKANIEWDNLKFEYSTEIDKRKAYLFELEKKIELIKTEQNPVTLASYDMCQLNKNDDASSSSSGFFSCCSCCRKNKVDENIPEDVEENVKSLREHLLKEYQETLASKKRSLDEYADAPPLKPVQYREAWNAAKAKIIHHRIDFFRRQSKEMMLHCVRLYVIAVRVFYQLYGENPIDDARQLIKKIPDENEVVISLAKNLFRQLIMGLKSQLSFFYCLQPNRVYFSTYLDNFNNIKDSRVRDALLSGKYTMKMLKQLFVDYESPDEAESTNLDMKATTTRSVK